MQQATAEPTTDLGIDPRELLRFRFPDAGLLDAARDLFPRPELVGRRGWQRLSETDYHERATVDLPGPWPVYQMGPGIARLRRRDLEADQRARERADEDRARKVREEVAFLNGPMALVQMPVRPKARVVESWSAKSRANLVRSILSLDLAPLVLGDQLPVMVTLTLPGDWLAVAPDAATAARKFDNFRRAYVKRWGAAQWIWKREFQRRGAPHWHLWLVPPSRDLREFQQWLSHTWTTCLQIDQAEERERSLAAGTNVSMAEGMRARDPKRLAIYFLKESLGGEGKAYQNDAPAEWAGESVGRFWGVVGIEYQLREVELDPRMADRVWRVLRHLRAAKAVTREVRVPRVNQRTGVVRYRTVRRRARSGGTAGWVAVNDGAAVASQLARWLAASTAEPATR